MLAHTIASEIAKLLSWHVNIDDTKVPAFVRCITREFPGMPYLKESLCDGQTRFHFKMEYMSLLDPLLRRPAVGEQVHLRTGEHRGKKALVTQDVSSVLPDEDRYILDVVGEDVGSYTRDEFMWMRR